MLPKLLNKEFNLDNTNVVEQLGYVITDCADYSLRVLQEQGKVPTGTYLSDLLQPEILFKEISDKNNPFRLLAQIYSLNNIPVYQNCGLVTKEYMRWGPDIDIQTGICRVGGFSTISQLSNGLSWFTDNILTLVPNTLDPEQFIIQHQRIAQRQISLSGMAKLLAEQGIKL